MANQAKVIRGSLKAFKKTGVSAPDVARFQENVDNALKPVLSSVLLDGVLLEGVELIAGQANVIEHKLEREPRGYIIVKRSANSQVWDEVSALKNSTLVLQCSANVTISLWVF